MSGAVQPKALLSEPRSASSLQPNETQGLLGAILVVLPKVSAFISHQDWYKNVLLINKSLHPHFEKATPLQYQRLSGSLLRVQIGPEEAGPSKNYWIQFRPDEGFKFVVVLPQEGITLHPCFKGIDHIEVVDNRNFLVIEITRMQHALLGLRWELQKLSRLKEKTDKQVALIKTWEGKKKYLKEEIKKAKVLLKKANEFMEAQVVEGDLLKGKAAYLNTGMLLTGEKSQLRQVLKIDDVNFRLREDVFSNMLSLQSEGFEGPVRLDAFQGNLRKQYIPPEKNSLPIPKEVKDLLRRIYEYTEQMRENELEIPSALERFLPLLIHGQNLRLWKELCTTTDFKKLTEELTTAGASEGLLDSLTVQLPNLVGDVKAKKDPGDPTAQEESKEEGAAAAPVAEVEVAGIEPNDSDTEGED